MSQKNRILIIVGVLAIVAIALGILGWLQSRTLVPTEEPEPGRIHVYVDGSFTANVDPTQVSALPNASFKDAEKDKTQEGPRLADLILLYVDANKLQPDSSISVTGIQPSNDQTKEVTLTWSQVLDPASNVILDYSATGDALKLVSTLPGLDTRDDWVQGLQRIDVTTSP